MKRHYSDLILLPVMASLLACQVCLAEQQGSLGSDRSQPKRLYDFGLGKRAAYTYLSEYKRLPIYNFGLGKRFEDSTAESGGTNDLQEMADYEATDTLKEADYKRLKQYSFGLGKRLGPSKQYSFGLGKRPAAPPVGGSEDEADYPQLVSDQDKRTNGNRFSFGLGKRSDAKQELRRSMQYNFGLGKRNQGPLYS